MTIHPDELRSIASAMIDYLGSNLLIVNFDGRSGQVLAKGALDQLNATEWEYSCNRRDWYQIGANGKIEPEFTVSRTGSFFFRHSSYREAGPIVVKENSSSIGMIKLQRNYADFTSNRFATNSKKSPPDSEEEKARIRQRLAQLLERGQNQGGIDNQLAVAHELSIPKEPVSSDFNSSEAVDPDEFAAPKKLDQPKMASFTATVIDALSNEPLKGAVVIVSGIQHTADNAGKITFTASPGSVQDLTAYFEGYEALKIRHRTGYRAGPLNLALKPIFASCSGRVTSFVDNSPVARALVKIGSRATRTSADGRFALRGIRPGFHQISVFAGDYLEAHEIAHIGTEPQQNINMQLRPLKAQKTEFLDDYMNM
jgi:hypothetical protein